MSGSPLDPALLSSLDLYCATTPDTGGAGDLVCRLKRVDPLRGVLLGASGALAGAFLAGDPVIGALVGGAAGGAAELLITVYSPRPNTLRGRTREAVSALGELT